MIDVLQQRYNHKNLKTSYSGMIVHTCERQAMKFTSITYKDLFICLSTKMYQPQLTWDCFLLILMPTIFIICMCVCGRGVAWWIYSVVGTAGYVDLCCDQVVPPPYHNAGEGGGRARDICYTSVFMKYKTWFVNLIVISLSWLVPPPSAPRKSGGDHSLVSKSGGTRDCEVTHSSVQNLVTVRIVHLYLHSAP